MADTERGWPRDRRVPSNRVRGQLGTGEDEVWLNRAPNFTAEPRLLVVTGRRRYNLSLSVEDAVPRLDVCAPAAWEPLQAVLVAQVGREQLSGGVEKRSR